MKRRTLSLCLALVMLLALAAGCSQNGNDGTTTPTQGTQADTAAATQTSATEGSTGQTSGEPKMLTLGFGYDATTLDVHQMTDDGSYELMRLIGEGLTRNDDGYISPGAAEKWDVSDDSLTYTFHLRSGLTWNDGTPLTAYDFEYSFLRVLNPDNALANASYLQIVKNAVAYYNGEAAAEDVGVKALDESTLEIVLETTNLELLYILAAYYSFPVNQAMVDAGGQAYGSEADSILTNGAFKLTQWAHEDRHVLEKSETYWNEDAINLEQIVRRVGVSEDTAYDMIQVGELDTYSFGDLTKATNLEANGFHSITYVSGYQFVHMNSQGSSEATRPFMENTNFRRALNYAVNREGIVASVYQGAEPAYRLTAPNMPGVNDSFHTEYPYEGWAPGGDPEKAVECLNLALDELGVTLADVPELSLLCYESQSSTLVLQAVQDMLLSTLGIKSKVDPQPIQQMLDKVDNDEWDFWWGGKVLGDVDWLSTTSFASNYVHDNPSQDGNYHNESVTALYYQAKAATSIKERKDLMFEIEKLLCENPGGILVGWRQQWTISDAKIIGIIENNGNINYTYADIG